MSPKDLLQSLKDGLERESSLEDPSISVKIQYCENLGRAIVAKFIEGEWRLFEVFVRPIGTAPDLKITC